jgi:hypothetical protein
MIFREHTKDTLNFLQALKKEFEALDRKVDNFQKEIEDELNSLQHLLESTAAYATDLVIEDLKDPLNLAIVAKKQQK